MIYVVILWNLTFIQADIIYVYNIYIYIYIYII